MGFCTHNRFQQTEWKHVSLWARQFWGPQCWNVYAILHLQALKSRGPTLLSKLN